MQSPFSDAGPVSVSLRGLQQLHLVRKEMDLVREKEKDLVREEEEKDLLREEEEKDLVREEEKDLVREEEKDLVREKEKDLVRETTQTTFVAQVSFHGSVLQSIERLVFLIYYYKASIFTFAQLTH